VPILPAAARPGDNERRSFGGKKLQQFSEQMSKSTQEFVVKESRKNLAHIGGRSDNGGNDVAEVNNLGKCHFAHHVFTTQDRTCALRKKLRPPRGWQKSLMTF
jgi:hypothetical protein